MSAGNQNFRSRARTAKLALWLAKRGSYNRSAFDKLCRWLVSRLAKTETDWRRDPLIDNDQGYDPDELERYQRGEIQ